MRRYEQIYILRPSLSEDEITTVIDNTTQIILDEGGTIISTSKWGMKKLAYPIKKELQGYYVFCDFTTTPTAVAEVERKFRIDDAVLKYLTIKLADDISAEEISAAQEEAAVKASRVEAEVEASDGTDAADESEEVKTKAEEKKPAAESSKEEEDKGEN